jgi:hypothetical protein
VAGVFSSDSVADGSMVRPAVRHYPANGVPGIVALILLALVVALFGTWLGLTIAFQFMKPSPQWGRHRNLIPGHLIPRWTLFVPARKSDQEGARRRPVGIDYRLFFQDYSAAGHLLGQVREIPIHLNRSAVHAIWNPHKRKRNAVFEIARLLQQEPLRSAGSAIQTAMPYLAILNVVMGPEPDSAVARYRRFIISVTGLDAEITRVPVFTSYLHPLHTEIRGG